MATISLCVIVKNEEEVLEECLKSVCECCDEIIIVDTGSTNKTKEIMHINSQQLLIVSPKYKNAYRKGALIFYISGLPLESFLKFMSCKSLI